MGAAHAAFALVGCAANAAFGGADFAVIEVFQAALLAVALVEFAQAFGLGLRRIRCRCCRGALAAGTAAGAGPAAGLTSI